MASAHSDTALTAHKILIAGGFGAGKTTLVSAISEVRPLLTEEPLSTASVGRDNLRGLPNKTTTTVALDFGRITIDDDIVLYLFGTPGQERFWFMWNELAFGAVGVVVLADTRRLADCFAAIDYFEMRHVPFVVGINQFDGAPRFHPEVVRNALDLDPQVPVVPCDARDRISCRDALVVLVEYARRLLETG
jgi:signal recognition particle receptor subunit beta